MKKGRIRPGVLYLGVPPQKLVKDEKGKFDGLRTEQPLCLSFGKFFLFALDFYVEFPPKSLALPFKISNSALRY